MPPKRTKKVAPPALPALDGCKIAFSGTFAGTSQTALKATAEGAGAAVSSSVTGDTTHLVASEADYHKSSAKVTKAQSLDIPIVTLQWLTLSAQNNAREAEDDFILGSAAQDDDNDDDAQPAASTSQATTAATNVKMQVRLTHDDHGQLGFVCEHIELDSISHLRRIIELNLGDQAELEREFAALLET